MRAAEHLMQSRDTREQHAISVLSQFLFIQAATQLSDTPVGHQVQCALGSCPAASGRCMGTHERAPTIGQACYKEYAAYAGLCSLAP